MLTATATRIVIQGFPEGDGDGHQTLCSLPGLISSGVFDRSRKESCGGRVDPFFPEFGGIIGEAAEGLEAVKKNGLGRVLVGDGEGGLEYVSESLSEVMSENVTMESLLLITSLEM